MKKIIVHALFIVLVVAAGFLAGVSNLPGPWYDGLNKPFFQPPPWLFSPVWTVLYILIAIAGARTWLAAPASGRMQIWFAQMALNLLWSPAFFGQQSPALGLVVIVPLAVLIFIFIVASWSRDRIAACLFVPYALWTSFATLLNASIFAMN